MYKTVSVRGEQSENYAYVREWVGALKRFIFLELVGSCVISGILFAALFRDSLGFVAGVLLILVLARFWGRL